MYAATKPSIERRAAGTFTFWKVIVVSDLWNKNPQKTAVYLSLSNWTRLRSRQHWMFAQLFDIRDYNDRWRDSVVMLTQVAPLEITF